MVMVVVVVVVVVMMVPMVMRWIDHHELGGGSHRAKQ